MTNKAYIVANERQVDEISKMLGINLTKMLVFPYVTYVDNVNSSLMYGGVGSIKNEKIAFDGRKEEKMSEKYVVSQKFMNELEEWRDANHLDHTHINGGDLLRLPTFILNFWLELGISQNEANNRIIAIIRWVNGEDAFEVEKPKKWVVRSKEVDSAYCYAQLLSENNNTLFMAYSFANATRFDTKEEAESWANSHQEVVEVVDV